MIPLHKKPNKFNPTFKNMLRERGETILVFPGIEREIDDMEKQKFVKLLNPIPIKAIVKDFSPTSLVWNNVGLSNIGAKSLTLEKKYEKLMKAAKKITIQDEDYCIFVDAVGSKFQIWKNTDTVNVIVTKT